MKIGIVSDTHGDRGAVEAVLGAAPGMDLWLHGGDFIDDGKYLEQLANTGVVKVAGNGDWPRGDAPNETVVKVAGHKIFLTHGHTYDVNHGTSILMEAARDAGCDIAVYGHTHRVDCTRDKITLLNPGSASRPRDERRPSFMVMELLPGQEPEVEVHRLND